MSIHENIKQIADECLSCKKANCQTACPLHMPISKVLKLVKENKFEDASRIIFANNLFPFVTGSLCDVNRKCQGSCILNVHQKPVSFHFIERILGINFYNQVLYKTASTSKTKVAIIGGGIAGLSVALTLIHQGITPEIFEKSNHLGGVLTTSLPSFRWEYDKIFKEYLHFIEENAVVHYNSCWGYNLLIDDIKEYDKVVFAFGASIPRKVLPDKYTYQAIDLLENESKRSSISGKYVVVLGCGNVAVDIARTMKRQKNHVEIIYRRNLANSPASLDEINHAIQEGVIFKECLSPLSVDEKRGSNHRLNLICEKMELFSDGSKRLNFRGTGELETIQTDIIIEAFGSVVDYQYFKTCCPTILDENNYITTNENYETNHNGWYLIGDALTGPSDFASAIASGMKVGQNISKMEVIAFPNVDEMILNQDIAFGGSFNPPTIAHLAIIKEILKHNPKRLILIPNGDKYHPFFETKKLASFSDRIAMCQLMVEELNDVRIEISEIENKASFEGTVNTLCKLNHPVFVMGSDCLETISNWIEYKTLVKENRFIVFTRHLNEDNIRRTILNDEYLKNYIDHFSTMALNLPNVSSSMFRNTKNMQMVSRKVLDYINKHGLYEVKNDT